MKRHLITPGNLFPLKSSIVLNKVWVAALLLLCMNFSKLTAANENLLGERIYLSVKNVTLKDALKEIERQSEFTFLYNDAVIDVNQNVTLSANELTVQELLDQMLKNKGINYTVIDNQIVLVKAAATANLQQKKTITGTILDAETSQGLPGVSVIEKGTTNGTVTDLDGKFNLKVADDAVVVISFVGFLTQEVSVAGITEINTSLESDIVSLEELVVIGYGTVKKSDLTGAIASISAEQIQQSASSGIDQALQGRTAGVNVTANSGSPGTAPSVRIRGTGTITNPDPFYIVDGVPVGTFEIGELNAGDIESMQVLKDASAAAIYGSRAANGVIIITTKSGSSGENKVNFDAYWGVQSQTNKYDLTSTDEYMGLRRKIGYIDSDSLTYAKTNWQDEVFRNAKIAKYQLDFQGGDKANHYAIIGSYYNQEGIIKGSDYERYTFRINSASQVKSWLKVGENIAFTNSKSNLIPERNEWTGVPITTITMDPAVPVYVYDSATGKNTSAGAIHNNINNPIGTIERNHNVFKSNLLLGNAFLEIKPVNWFTYRGTIGGFIKRQDNEQYFPAFIESTSNQRPINGLFNGTFDNKTFIWENTAEFKKTFAEKHALTVLAGYSRQQSSYRLKVSYANDVPENELLWFVSNASDPKTNTVADRYTGDFNSVVLPFAIPFTQPSDASMVSYLGRVIYSYNNFFDFTGSVRRDASSKFSKNNRWAVFPSFAAGLKLSELGFMKDKTPINFLKLRAGWGKLGNQEIGDYKTYSQINGPYNYNYGSAASQTLFPGGAPSTIANQDIHWEETVMTNFGFDFGVFKNKLTGSFDYYIRNTIDMLLEVPIPGFTGALTNPTVNIGTVNNTGYEFILEYKEIRGDFSYSIAGNIGVNKNEVTSLGVEGTTIASGNFRAYDDATLTAVGQPIASFYGYKTDGYWQNQAEIDAANQAARDAAGEPNSTKIFYDRPKTAPGDVKFLDLDGDGKVTDIDKDFIGTPHPKLSYGINLTANYRIFDLSIFGFGVTGNDIFMATNWYTENSGAYFNMTKNSLDYWQNEGDNSAVPRLDPNADNENQRFSDRYVKDGSYFRIKNMQLGISLPKSSCDKLKIEKIRLYVQAQNVLTLTKYEGFDPEIGRGNGYLDIGVDRGNYPVAKSYLLGVNFTF